ncbi:MAG: DUF2848 family protein [Pseudomonadota bacterium]
MLEFHTPDGSVEVVPTALVIAGWTGRDESAVEHHIEELAAIGVARPSTVPLFYRVGVNQLNQTRAIEVVGPDTSGEVEPVIVHTHGRFLLTVGSDHTDRALEAHSVALSKQIAPKPIADHAWWLDAVRDLDQLSLTADVSDDGAAFHPYQAGTLAMIRPLQELLAGAEAALGSLPEGLVLYCGTVPTIDGKVRPSRQFRGAISDTASGQTLKVAYQTTVLPLVA